MRTAPITAVLYDDGDTERLNLSEEKFELLARGSEKKEKQRLKRSSKQTVVPSAVDGLEDSDVEMSDAGASDAGSDFMASDVSEEEYDAEEALEDSGEDAVMSCDESEEAVKIQRKRPAKQVDRPAKATKAAHYEGQSENVDHSNGAGLKSLSPIARASGSLPEATKTPALTQRTSNDGTTNRTPCTGELRSRLSLATPGTAQTDGRSALGMILSIYCIHLASAVRWHYACVNGGLLEPDSIAQHTVRVLLLTFASS